MISVKSRKLCSIIFCVVLALSLCGMTLTLKTFSANAVDSDVSSAINDFSMENSASVRIGSNDNKYGLRYAFTMPEASYNTVKSAYPDVTFGILIAPNEWNDICELNAANVFGTDAKYCYATFNKTTGKWDKPANSEGKSQIINFSTNELTENIEGKLGFTGAMVNLLENNLTREFRAVAYISYTNDGVTEYVFKNDDRTVRSMTYVAMLALEEQNSGLGSESKTFLQTNYVDKVKNLDTNYFVEYYKQNDNGDYVKDETLTKTIATKIATEVSATVESLDGYVFNAAKGKLTGKAYPNDKLTLSVYYDKEDAHAFKWEKKDTAYEYKCSNCGTVSKSLTKHEFDTKTLTSRFAVSAGETNAVSFENSKISVNLSAGNGASETSIVLDKKYEEFVMNYHFEYLSTAYTGERYAKINVGNCSVKYYPYADLIQVYSGADVVAACYGGHLSEHLEIDVEIKLLDGKLFVSVDGELLQSILEDDCDYTVNNVTGAQTIGIYASRVQFEMSDLVMYNGAGEDRKESDVYDSAKLKQSTVTCPTYGENNVSLENDKIKFTLSNDTASSSNEYDAKVTLGTAYTGNFELNFDLTYETGHTSTRFLAIYIGGVTFRIDPSEEKVLAVRGSYDQTAAYATIQNATYMSGNITIRLENGNIYFLHNGERLAFNGDSNFYFSNIDSSSGLNIVFAARRLNLEISNLTVTEI